MTTMTHEGYVATIELDEEAAIFHGRVINARAILTFEGQTIKELKRSLLKQLMIIANGARSAAKLQRSLIRETYH